MADDLESLVLTISADTRQIQRALKRLEGDTSGSLDRVEKAFDRPVDGVDRLSKKLGQTRFETANLAAQFQDIAVQMQSGQSPFTIALQQGTQISTVLGTRGAAGAVGLLGAAFGSLLNPVSLATIGIIALGGVAVKYISQISGGVKGVDEALEEHAKLIASLKDAYGEAGKGVEAYAKESRAVIEAQLHISVADLQKKFASLTGEIDKTTSSSKALVEHMAAVAQTAGVTVPPEALTRFKAITDAVDRFREGLASGQPDVRAFRDELARLLLDNADDTQLRKIIKNMLEMTSEAAKVQTAINAFGKSLRALSAVAQGSAQQLTEFNAALKELAGIAAPDLDDRAKALKKYQEAIGKAGGLEDRIVAERQYSETLRNITAKEQKAADDAAKKEADRLAKRGARRQEAFSRDLLDIQKRTAALLLEVDMIGKTEQERDKARAMLELENEARRAGITTLTDAQKTQIESLAGAYADAAEKARKANEFMADIREVGSAAADAFKGLVLEGKNFNEVLDQMLKRLASRAIDKLFDGIFSALGGSLFKSIGEGGGLGSLFGGGRASGGPVQAGVAYRVNEQTPRSEWFLPDVSGRIVTDRQMRQSGGQSVTVSPTYNIDARGADQAAIARLERALVATNASIESRAVAAVSGRQARF